MSAISIPGQVLAWAMKGVDGGAAHLTEKVCAAARGAWQPPAPVERRGFVSHLGGAEALSVRWVEVRPPHLVVEVSVRTIGPTGIALAPSRQVICVLGDDEQPLQVGIPVEWVAPFTAVLDVARLEVERQFRALAPSIVPGSLTFWVAAFPDHLSTATGAAERLITLRLVEALKEGSVRAEVTIVESEVETARTLETFEVGQALTWPSLEALETTVHERFAGCDLDRIAEFFRLL